MKKSISSLLILLLCLSLHAQDLPRFVSDSLDTYCKNGIKEWQIPGMAVAIVKDGKVVFMKGYGIRESGKTEPVDENTLFMIGSNTKLFTATALTLLEQNNKITLNDPVTRWIPAFRLKNPLATEQVTIKDLLCHRLGFETFQGDFTYWTSTLTRDQVIEKMALVEPVYGFRAKWGYTNAAFVTAGKVLESAAGQTWESFIREKFIRPLSMDRTLLLSADLRSATNAASPHTLVDGRLTRIPVPSIDNLAPAGSMSSSVRDMTRWLITQLDMGMIDGKQVIPANAIAVTRRAASILGTDIRDKVHSHFLLYGLGLELNDRDGKLVCSHTGGVDGFVSSVVFIPELKVGMVVLTNTDQNEFFQDLTSEITDAFLGIPYTGYSKQSLERTRVTRKAAKDRMDSLKLVVARKSKPEVDLKRYAGDYTNALYGDMQVKLEAGKLTLHFSHHPDLVGHLELEEKSTFLCTYSNPTFGVKEIPFHVKDGNITGLTLHVADFVEFTPYEFVKK